MKVSVFTTVTVTMTDYRLTLLGTISKFTVCFTGIPTKNKLIESIYYKCELEDIPIKAIQNIMQIANELPQGEVMQTSNYYGCVSVKKAEPLFKA